MTNPASVYSTCPRCRAPLHLVPVDALQAPQETAPPVVYACLNGHTLRVWAAELGRAMLPAGPRPCAVCGEPLARLGKYHAGRCAIFATRDRASARKRGDIWLLEARPWYRGPVTAFQGAPAGPPGTPERIPATWWSGWSKVHYGTTAAILVAILATLMVMPWW